MFNIDINFKEFGSAAELFLRKNGPTIAFAAGTTMVVGGSALAVAKTIKRTHGANKDECVREIIDNYKIERDDLEYQKEVYYPEMQRELDRKIRNTYVREAGELGKIYWLPFALVTVGLGLTVGGYIAIGARLATMTSAYNKLAASNALLLEKAKDKLELKEGEKLEIPEGAYTSNPNYDIDPSTITGMPYSYWYCKDKFNGKPNTRWSNSMDSNFANLACAFERLNQRFTGKGYMYVNEILETLSIALEPEGYQVGYIYSLTEDVQNQIDFYASAYKINDDGTVELFTGDEIPEGADVRIALSIVPDGAVDRCVYSRLFKTL